MHRAIAQMVHAVLAFLVFNSGAFDLYEEAVEFAFDYAAGGVGGLEVLAVDLVEDGPVLDVGKVHG